MPIPKNYQQSQETAIASFAYTEISSGTGFVLFYAMNAEENASDKIRLLGENVVASLLIEGTFTTTTFNYDLTPFNLPQTVKGTAIIRYSTYWTGTGGNTKFETITIQKVSDGVVTDIGSERTNTETGSGSVIRKNHLLNIPLTQTHFKKGDILRLEIDPTNPQSNTITIGEDPSNRDGTLITPAATYPTKFEVYIPFRIDL